MTTIDVQAIYRQCPQCAAPIVMPCPQTWHVDWIKEGPREGPVHGFLTPHRPDCTADVPDPQPGMALRTRGAWVIAAASW